ncbi:MAG TPA: hypothetical protein VES40_07765 [Ilumatobacteraceae bacterium]|nr:hypothetical protein [Ilumatobacteraceae bacterium]
MSVRTAAVAVLATAAFVVLPTHQTLAAFSADGVGSGLTASASIPSSAAPSATVVGRDVTVSWPTTTLSSGVPAEGYTVRRYDTSNAAQTVLADCIAPASTSCVENNVPIGTWVYTVQARTGSWTGPEGLASAAVTVATSTFVLDSTAPITALPAVVTGTINNFLLGESVTYHLDSPTGPALAGSPSVVASSTSMPVSVTVPAGTTDAPHSVFVVGSGGSIASAAIDIVIPPVLQSMAMRDIDSNGKVDTVTVVFDDTLAGYSAGLAPWTLANVPSGGTLSGVTVSGSTATLSIAEGPGAANTAVGAFTVALASNPAGVRDIYDHTSSFAPTAPTDLAAPAAQALTMQDTNANGKVDRLTMTFSEALAPYSAPSTVWSLANVPSGGSLGAVTVTSPTVSIAVTEGAGAANTAVGSFTVTLAPNADGVRDAAGNLSSFTKAPADGARPIRQSQEMFDDNRNGKIDRVLVTFSEALAPFSAPTSFSLSSAPSGATLSTVGISGTQATLALNEGTGAATTAVGAFRVTLTSNAAGIRDASGNLASYAATAPTDRAAPALVTLSALDNNGNGKVDRVTALFSETLQAYTAGTAPWTLANVPSGGTLARVTRAASTLTLTLTEGPGAANTSIGTMTVAMASNPAGARDALANLGSFAATAPLDRAKPAAVTITDTNGSTDGRVQPGDTVVITFSEPLAPASVPGSTTVTLTDPTGTGNDTLTMLGVSNAARSLGSNNYITLDTGVASFAGSAVTLGNSNRTVTVTIGASCTGTGCAAIGQQLTNANYSFVAAPTLTDTTGNTAATAARTQSIRLF